MSRKHRPQQGSTPPRSQFHHDLTTGPHEGRQAAALEPFRGKWVALGEPDEVLVAAETAREVVAWLSRNEIKATGMFRVPDSAREAEGLAPH
jgi:hypothetical protein